jgi:hypothetical protein
MGVLEKTLNLVCVGAREKQLDMNVRLWLNAGIFVVSYLVFF